MFKNIFELEPGHYLRVTSSGRESRRYWDLQYPKNGEYEQKKECVWIDSLSALLEDSVKIRLQADVPVGVYLSGGLDSSAVAALAVGTDAPKPQSFSLRFEDPAFDESRYQSMVAAHLNLKNSHVQISQDDLARALPRAVYHAENPVLRTAMVPLYLLSRHVRQNHFKAVLTGEGADEMLLGYDIFKELKIRSFCSRFPESTRRPRLFELLYPHLAIQKNFFTNGLEKADSWDISHAIRWQNTSRLQRFFSKELKETLDGYDPREELRGKLPTDFSSWDPIAKTQYLECRLFLSRYLLSSQGDRMSMANSVEARYPYLDHRVVELANRIPPRVKMKGLREKAVLKQCMKEKLPTAVLDRRKYPYRAPGMTMAPLLEEHLSDSRLKDAAHWDGVLVRLLMAKIRGAEEDLSEADQMAVSGILTTQIFHSVFIRHEEPLLV